MKSKMKAMEGWKRTQLGKVATLVKGISYESKDYCDAGEGSIFITIKCISKAGGFKREGLKYFKGPINASQVLQPGELLIANTDLTRAGDIVGCPMVVPIISGETITMSMDLSKVVEDDTKIDRNFLYYKLMTDSVRRFMKDHASGSTVLHLQTRAVPGLELEIPTSKPEQTKIAEILSTVDQAIEQTEALIAKQQRIKTGLMQDLLTRGIDEHGNLRTEQTHKFKDSPLGRIPVEWEVVPLSELADAIDPQPDHRTPAEVADGVPYIGVSDFNEDESINFDKARKVSVAALRKQQRAFLISKNDFVFGKIGTIGAPSRIPTCIEYAISANVILLKPFEAPSFVYWWMASPIAERRVDLELHTTSQPAFGIQKMRTFKIPKPSKEEREEIGDLLNEVGSVEQCTERDLKKLQSLKTSLMQDLLKGKIRVTSLIKQ